MLGFSIEQVSRLTKLSVRQLVYWDQTGFFSPEFASANRRQPFSRVYSFRDLVGLRTVADLRRKLPLQELRRVSCWLKERYDEPWSRLVFYIVDRKVLFSEGTAGQPMVAGSGQLALQVRLEPIARATEEDARALTRRTEDEVGRITSNRFLMHNAPVLAGTRIPVAAVWDLYQAGYSPAQIVAEYPRLREADVAAVLEYERSRAEKAAG